MLVHFVWAAQAPHPAATVSKLVRRVQGEAVTVCSRFVVKVQHRYEDVTDVITVAGIRVGHFWNETRIEEVSLVALDQLGHVTVRLATKRCESIAELVSWNEARHGDGWLPTEEAARLAYEGSVRSCLC
jgi:hypothetical protein